MRPSLKLTALSALSVIACSAPADHAAASDPGAGAAGGVPPMVIGLNVSQAVYWSQERALANLVASNGWSIDGPSAPNGWREVPVQDLGPGGSIDVPPDNAAIRIISTPARPARAHKIRCTWQGQGAMTAGGLARVTGGNARGVDLQFAPSEAGSGNIGWLRMTAQQPGDPVKGVDCREGDMAPDAVFAPEFENFVRPFKVIRFLDWQMTNLNQAHPSWDRAMDLTRVQNGPDGVAIPNLVRLVNDVDADPWFLIPYNADDAYILAFARYVHDHVKPGRTVYVELGNEVWNFVFKGTIQAKEEGARLGLPGTEYEQIMRRYAQKSAHALKIWTEVFADRPERLVRVVSTQAGCIMCAETILSFENTARWVDALAVAPYIQLDPKPYEPARLDDLFTAAQLASDKAIDGAVKMKGVANRFGKRLIAYEAGHHLVFTNTAMSRAFNRDPRVGALYRRYLDGWQRQVGDVIMLYSATGPVTNMGWGLREYAGQPVKDAPKLDATLSYLGHDRRP